jgi:hypothetical protein
VARKKEMGNSNTQERKLAKVANLDGKEAF